MKINGKELPVTELFPPIKNKLINNLIALDDKGDADSTLVVFTEGITTAGAAIADNDNLFEYNKYYNANLGEIPHRADEDKLKTRPEIRTPDVWPRITEDDLKRLGIKK